MPLDRHALCLRRRQRAGPGWQGGVANYIASMMDEGAGELTSKQFQERMEAIAMRMSFDDCARCHSTAASRR